MRRFLCLPLLLVVLWPACLAAADSQDDELFRLRLENAALRARIEAGIAELTKPIDEEPGVSLANVESGRVTLPQAPPDEPALPPEAQPTPLAHVHRALAELDLSSSDVLGDIGCGADARVLIEAARVYGCRGVGLEIDAGRAASAKRAVEQAGLTHKIAIYNVDAMDAKWEFNKAYVYLWQETLRPLASRLAGLDRVVSYQHYVPGLTMTKRDSFYLWSSPQQAAASHVVARVADTPTVSYQQSPASYTAQRTVTRQKTATWEGQEYTGPLCTRGNCAMCNSIRSQLRRW